MNKLPIVQLFSLLLFCSPLMAQNLFLPKEFPQEEFQVRRQKALELYANDLLVFPSNTRLKTDEQHGFIQNTSFYYFSGLANLVGSILVIDGPQKKSILFTRSTIGLAPVMESLAILPRTTRVRDSLLLDDVLPYEQFESYINNRLQSNPLAKIYADYQREGIRIQNFAVIKDEWMEGLKAKWPGKVFVPTKALALQEIKSSKELEAMAFAAKNAVNGLLSAIRTIQPGIISRQVEGKIVYECLCSGGNGVYFWPLVLQGKLAEYPGFFSVFSDYKNGSEILKSGELVRLDIGCDYNHYKSDVGRTVPVSGKFAPAQKEVNDLFTAGYLAALKTFKDGTSYATIVEAFKAAISLRQSTLKTSHGKKAYDILMSKDGLSKFQVHEMGLGGTEKQVDTLKKGMVVAWEPMLTVEDQSYYLEDLMEITATGYKNLTPGLPYFSHEIEKLMRSSTNKKKTQ